MREGTDLPGLDFNGATRDQGLPPSRTDRPAGAPGLLLIQIDALGYEHLRRALAAGYLPFLQSLLASGLADLQRWRCGIPSDTPSVQCGLMYGYRDDVVGFYWLDRQADRWVNCANPWHVAAIERRIARAGRPGLLTGGSAYVTVIAGGAAHAVFSTSRLDPGRLRPWQAMPLLRRPDAIAAGLGHAVGNAAAELRHYLRQGRWHASVPKELFFLAARLFMHVALRQVALTGALADIRRGRPTIFVGFSGYDLVGHFYGPTSVNAFQTLTDIDTAIATIYRASLAAPRRYRLIVFSDHGMCPAIPFTRLYGQPLARFIHALVPDDVMAVDSGHAAGPATDTWLGRQVDRICSWLSQASALTPREILKSHQLAVVATSPIAHVYLKSTQRPLDLSDVAARHPTLIERVVGHEGIGLVVGRQGETVVVIGKAGQRLIGTRESVVIGHDPLADYEEPTIMANQLRQFALMPSVGDFIVFGARHGESVVCFEDQIGTHGGLGGDQSYPFFLYPAAEPLDLSDVQDATDLYPILARFRQPLDEAAPMEPLVGLVGAERPMG